MPSQTFRGSDQLSLFRSAFFALTDTRPFPWQEHLYLNCFSQGEFPSSCNLPTGLGKTSVIAVWLIALAHYPQRLPRRLVYVVNRRTVVDQTTNEVEKLRGNLNAACLFEPLRALCGLPLKNNDPPLAISTLRGQFADNREWSRDPARPSVIVGTVDMIGSRFLFSGYGIGFKVRPLHAGFLAQDALLVHDEAHLEPAFQSLLAEIAAEQKRSNEFGKFHLMALTATSRNGDASSAFELTEQEKNPPEELPNPQSEPVHTVWQRLKAPKGIEFHPVVDRDRVASEVRQLALRHKDSGKAILIFVRSVEDVDKTRQMLTKSDVDEAQIQTLTGTLRGLERDKLPDNDVFRRFLVRPSEEKRAVYLICTSAGEVGIDISADHMVCDLTPLDSMTQRLGRVNRRGEGSAEIDVVYENGSHDPDKETAFDRARRKTLELLQELPASKWPDSHRRYDASPLALWNLNLSEEERREAFTPEPVILPTSDILFDFWTLTTIRERVPGRPHVERYLHGVAEWEPRETYVAWRDEVDIIRDDLLDAYKPEDLLEDYPLKPHELLRDRSDRVLRQLQKIAKRKPEAPLWLVDEDGAVQITTLGNLTEKEQIEQRTVLLPPSAGGLNAGFLSGDSAAAGDVADEWRDSEGNSRRVRVWDDAAAPDGMRLIRKIDTRPYAEEAEEEEGAGTTGRYWRWYELPRTGDGDGSKAATKPVALDVHTDDVTANAKRIVERLGLPEDIANAIVAAAKFHDLGKRRPLFQRILGNRKPDILLAKSGRNGQALRLPETYRHEFGSLLDIGLKSEFARLSDEMKDLVLHLIASHHGRARPYFPGDEAFDPEPNGRDLGAVAAEVPRRFARLQRKYGRWGLAYLESLLRAADYAASANPSAFLEDAQ